MNWIDTHNEDGSRRDLVERWEEFKTADVSPWAVSNEKMAECLAHTHKLTADLAALCEELTKCANSNVLSPLLNDIEVRKEVMKHARKPDGSPRWPGRGEG